MNFPRPLRYIAGVSGTLVLLSSGAQAQQKQQVMRDVATSETISQEIRKKQASAALNPTQGKAKPLGEDPAKKLKEEQSATAETIFASNGTWTPVPPRAVLFVPPVHQAKLVKAPAGKIVSWADFYAANRNWIIELEVKPEQVLGKAPIDPAIVNSWKLRNCVIVAVSRGNLVSVVNPPKPQQ